MLSLVSSILTLTLISCDRFFGIVFAMKAHMTSHRSPFVLLLIWVCALALSSPLLLYREQHERSWRNHTEIWWATYPKTYAHGFCFAVLCCVYWLTDFPISIRRTSLALWQSNDCPSASNAALMNMDKYFIWIHYERLHNHNKAKHNIPVCIFLGYPVQGFVFSTVRRRCRKTVSQGGPSFFMEGLWQRQIPVVIQEL